LELFVLRGRAEVSTMVKWPCLALWIGLCGIGLGCSGNMTGSNNQGLTLFPTNAYTGFDESSKYSVPIAVSGATGVTWSSSDSSIATVTGNDSVATVSAVKAGSATITATANGKSATATITVSQYQAADKTAGQNEFTQVGCNKSGCHDSSGPDISPSGIGKHTDAQIVAAAKTGANPEGGDISIGASAHSFAPVTTSIATWLRAMQAKGTPQPDQ
jgi:hypothetical protein